MPKDLLDLAEFKTWLTKKAKEKKKAGYAKRNNDMEQMQARGARTAYEDVLRFVKIVESEET